MGARRRAGHGAVVLRAGGVDGKIGGGLAPGVLAQTTASNTVALSFSCALVASAGLLGLRSRAGRVQVAEAPERADGADA